MINTSIGFAGHFFVILSFVAALVAAIGYFVAANLQKNGKTEDLITWKRFSRLAFYTHGIAVLGIIGSLFYIIYHHLYEYHYAWSHSSSNLPVYYMISCFWEGQEGSFLLWIFWQVLLGLILIQSNKFWESPLMAVFALVQAFLTSMILGIVIPWVNIKLGSDPFILLRDAMLDIPVFQAGSQVYNPNFVPNDGKGLNPLLQNYWMVIHPPTLFLGFATTLIPFAYCIAGLWQQKYREWIRPALPWALFSGAVLGLGILMGGYWAYETLNFGGYWNWDPVENAVYVPWLFLIATIHTMIAFKKNQTALKASIVLSVLTFILILYATFLTRSGVLGNASVHSFTDLGLSGQLLIYLLSFLGLSIVLVVYRWKEIPSTKEEVSTYSREFWIFMGATVLCLAGFQVLFTTSIPVYNALIESFGFVSNMALPANQIEHYTKFQLWAAVLVAILSGTGQFFWWQKMDKESLFKSLVSPLIFTLLLASLVIIFIQITHLPFIILFTSALYSVIANSFVLVSFLSKSSYKLAGGSIAHIGLAMMLMGILFSSGYSGVISKNTSGLLYSKDFTTEMNEDNVLLWLNQPVAMKEYQISYKGDYLEAKGFPDYIKKSALMATNDPFKAVALEEIFYKDKIYFKKGDSLIIYPENTYYKVEYRDKGGKIFALYPRAQVNPQMGLIASPDIYRTLNKDLYTHVSSIPDPTKEKEWSETQEFSVAVKDTFFVNDYVAIFENVIRLAEEELGTSIGKSVKLSPKDAGVKAIIKVLGKDKSYELNPVFFIQNEMVGRIPDLEEELGLRIALTNIDPQNGKFTFAANTTQKDYIIMKAMEKPLINVLWIGTLVLLLGFGIAIYRRWSEFSKMRDKGVE